MPVPSRLRAPALLLASLLALGLARPLPAQAATAEAGVAWQAASADADIERHFAQARSEHKPVLLYWGARWCPPCNQLKATLFNRQDFIERSRAVLPVYLDGDAPGAQKLGGRFKVRGYPTMILFNPEGQEITRLPGEVDAPQVLQVLQLALAGGRPVASVLADARAGKALAPRDWQLLAFYAWDVDEAQLVSAVERPGLLAQLAAACPASEPATANRLLLKALAGSDEGKGLKADAATRQRVRRLLDDPLASRAVMDVLVNSAPELARALAPQPGAERATLAAAMDAALGRLQADSSLSRADRMAALIARVDLLRLDAPKDMLQPKMPPSVLQQVRDEAARADREITDGYERQAVITSAGHLLAQAGLWKDSDALLKANLSRSHSPYYLMSQLGGNARRQGRSAEALDWYGQAFARSEGPATRLQWGASYLVALVELAPQDESRIEQTAAALLREAGGQSAAFHERSARSLQRVSAKLGEWNAKGQHAAVLGRLRGQLAPICARLPAGDTQRGTCEALIKA